MNDYSLFTKRTASSFTIVAVYVDDILVTGNDSSVIQSLKHHLHSAFSIKDLGPLHYFLGLEISYLATGIAITQRKFAKDLLQHSGISHFKKAVTPLPLNLKL